MREPENADGSLFSNLGQRAEFERRKVEHEDTVLDHRLSWLTTSQSILATAYVLRFTQSVPWGVRLALPAMALITCVLFNVGIQAAMSASRTVVARWDGSYEDHRGELLADPDMRERGWVPAKTVPGVLILAWAVALLVEIIRCIF